MLRTKHSNKNENMLGWTIDGKPVTRQVGMIYWYSWGRHEFDVRILRKALGLPMEMTADKYFMAKRPNPCKAFSEIMTQIETASTGKKFSKIIAEHDRLLNEEAEADRVHHQAMQAKMAKLPKVFKIGNLPGLMAQVDAGVDFRKVEAPPELSDECPF